MFLKPFRRGRWLEFARALALATGLTACGGTGEPVAAKPSSRDAPSPVVAVEAAPRRPADVAEGQLSIGDVSFAAGEVYARRVEDVMGEPALSIELAPAAAGALEALTTERIGQEVAFVLNGEEVMRPIVRETISGGKVMIAGQFTVQEIDDIALQCAPACE